MDLLELSDSQWISLSQLVNNLATSLDQPKSTTQRLISAFAINMVRPVRVSFSDGTGRRLTNTDSSNDNELLASIIGYQLMFSDEQQQLAESERQLYNDASIEFTIPALHDWIVQCDLPEIADSLFGQWVETTQPVLVKNNLLVATTTDNKNATLAPTDNRLTLSYDEILELTGKKRGFAQHHVLQSMRIASKIRADGAVIVLRHDLQASTNKKQKPKVQPNFDALG